MATKNELMKKRYFAFFVLPAFIAFTIGFIIPFIGGVLLSFCRFTVINNAEFIGIKNYISAFTDKSFLAALFFTTKAAFVMTALINILGFVFAVILTRNIIGKSIFRTVLFVPNLIGGIVLGYIWQIIINYVLSVIDKPLLALNSAAGFWGIIILMCWQQIGYVMIIYIAALQSVPDELSEAAQIDGASAMQTLFKIKMPMLVPSIMICVFITLTNAFKLFDQNLALTAGEPSHATEMLALNIYNNFYARPGLMWRGIGQAKAVLFCVIVILLAYGQFRLTKQKDGEDNE